MKSRWVVFTAGSVQLNTDKQKIFDQPVVRTSIKSTINLWNSTIVLKFYNCMMVAYAWGWWCPRIHRLLSFPKSLIIYDNKTALPLPPLMQQNVTLGWPGSSNISPHASTLTPTWIVFKLFSQQIVNVNSSTFWRIVFLTLNFSCHISGSLD